jgi:hypothetical protein
MDHVNRSRSTEIIHQELQAFIANGSLDPCWRRLAADLQALPLLFSPHHVALRANGEFISFDVNSWHEGVVPETRREDDPAVLTEALFDGIKRFPPLHILCPAKPANAVACWQCAGTEKPAQPAADPCVCGGLGWLPFNRCRDPETLVIACAGPEGIRQAIREVHLQLAPMHRKRLNKITSPHLFDGTAGDEAMYRLMNGRTVAAILAEHRPEQNPKPIASGQVGSVRYELSDNRDRK